MKGNQDDDNNVKLYNYNISTMIQNLYIRKIIILKYSREEKNTKLRPEFRHDILINLKCTKHLEQKQQKVRQAYKGKIWQVGVAKFMVGQQI